MSTAIDLHGLAAKMRENSERWFPGWHDGSTGMPLRVAYALGLAGEVGEVANEVKKMQRDGWTQEAHERLATELADVLTYLLLLADEEGVDIIASYEAKATFNEGRWGCGQPDTSSAVSGSTQA